MPKLGDCLFCDGSAFRALWGYFDTYLSEMVCGSAYDSKYLQFGHRNVVTGMTCSFSTLRPVQKLGSGSPGDQFCRSTPRCM